MHRQKKNLKNKKNYTCFSIQTKVIETFLMEFYISIPKMILIIIDKVEGDKSVTKFTEKCLTLINRRFI